MKKLLILPIVALVLGLAAPVFAASKGNVYANPTHRYSIVVPKGYYPHRTSMNTVFTRQSKQTIPAYTDGYALAPVFTITVLNRADDQGTTTPVKQWLRQNVGTVDSNGKKLQQRWANVQGRQMLEVIGSAAGADGRQVSYFYFTPKRVFHFFQYPYIAGSDDTTAFQKALATFKLTK